MEKRILSTIILLLILVQGVSALTANSSSYSVDMFGAGNQASNPSSTNYESTVLSTTEPSTRNAQSSDYQANIGFYNSTPYLVATINSYLIYPKSAVQGSIMRFSISAVNQQAVWAKIILPDGSQESINLVNNGYTYYVANKVGRYTATLYANSSTGSVTSILDYFDITSTPITPSITPQQPSGEAQGSCKYVWDCDSWSICEKNIQTRVCKNTGTCTGTEGKPIEERNCSEALFDVTLKLSSIELTENEKLKFSIDLREKGGIEKIDVQVRYTVFKKITPSIIGRVISSLTGNAISDEESYNQIYSNLETVAVKNSLVYEKVIDEVTLLEGEYKLRIDIVYGNQQKAFAEQTFTVTADKKIKITPQSTSNYNRPLLLAMGLGILILVLLLIFIIIKKSRRKKKELIKESLGAGLKHLAKRGIDEARLIYGKIRKICNRVIEFLTRTGNIYHKYPRNSIRGLMNKSVYSESSGEILGKVKEIYLEGHRIHSILINLTNKKLEKLKKGVIIKFHHIISIGDIIIVKEEISKYLHNLGSQK